MVKASNGGVGIFGTVGIVFIVLKLAGVVDWPWWVVLCPLWVPLALLLLLIMVVLVSELPSIIKEVKDENKEEK